MPVIVPGIRSPLTRPRWDSEPTAFKGRPPCSTMWRICGGLEIDRRGHIIAPPDRLGTFLDAQERPVQLVAIGEAEQIRPLRGGKAGRDNQPGNDGGADHFS